MPLVRPLTGEATRAVFRIVHAHGLVQFPRAGLVLGRPRLAIHVRGLVWSEIVRGALAAVGLRFARRLEWLIVACWHIQLTSIELDSLSLDCVQVLFSKLHQVLAFLNHAERFRLVIDNSMMRTHPDPDDFEWSLMNFSRPSVHMPALQDLPLGFTRCAPLYWERYSLHAQYALEKFMLHGVFPRLSSLNLRKVALWGKWRLFAFFDIHNDTLKSLTLEDMSLDIPGEYASREDCLFFIFQLLHGLRNRTRLERMNFKGVLHARSWKRGKIEDAEAVRIFCRDEADSPNVLPTPLRRGVEDYVCGRGDALPFITHQAREDITPQVVDTLQEDFVNTQHELRGICRAVRS